ncbi:hypothetical protein M9H77_07340 [Catharanthus roseus]|uniref:Uncharacterized protein n=1 Tax=Catharanthus roseus TaxID=4058 RepID=A0ACC0BUP8_CATRO|nr:hypothetical protein M9H77_07340 [Catharanthus roseus]
MENNIGSVPINVSCHWVINLDEIPSLSRRVEIKTTHWRYGGYDPFVLAHQAEQDLFLPYPSFKRPRNDWVSMVKSRLRLIDNVDIHDGSAIDVTIEDVGPFVHESRSSEELDIASEMYFEEKIPMKTLMKRPTRILMLHPIMILMRISTYRTLYDYISLPSPPPPPPSQTKVPASFDALGSSSAPTTQPSSSTAPFTASAAWKPPLDYIHLRELPPISQLSYRNGLPALNTVDLRSCQISKSFR